MVSTTVDNTPVNAALAGGESLSVPSGETWRVTITANTSDPNGQTTTRCAADLNGGPFVVGADNGNFAQAEVTLTAGDTINVSAQDSSLGVLVSGFKV